MEKKKKWKKREKERKLIVHTNENSLAVTICIYINI